MTTQYILFIVINNIKKFKDIKKRLIQLDYKRFTAIDTYGSTELYMDMEYSRLLSDAIGEQNNKKYNKTILLALETEEEVLKVMDEVQDVLNLITKKPGGGIMFTVPIVKSQGIRF